MKIGAEAPWLVNRSRSHHGDSSTAHAQSAIGSLDLDCPFAL